MPWSLPWQTWTCHDSFSLFIFQVTLSICVWLWAVGRAITSVLKKRTLIKNDHMIELVYLMELSSFHQHLSQTLCSKKNVWTENVWLCSSLSIDFPAAFFWGNRIERVYLNGHFGRFSEQAGSICKGSFWQDVSNRSTGCLNLQLRNSWESQFHSSES